MEYKKTIAIILVLALVLRIFFALAVPIFQKPDEDAHFEYIEFVADNKKLPVQGNTYAEFFQPPVYYVIASFILGFLRIFTENVWFHVIFMRLISVFFSMLTLYTIYKIASLIFSNRNLVIGILAFASFLPTHINVNSNVTNANMSQFLATLIIYFLISNLAKKEDQKRNVLLGGIAGLALITRQSVIPAVLTIPFAFAVKFFPKIKKAVKPVVVIAIISLAISVLFFARNFVLYGDFLAYNAMQMSTPPDFMPKDLTFVAKLMIWTFASFWATFGRINNVFIGDINSSGGIAILFVFYSLLLIASLGSVFGLYKVYKKYRKDKKIFTDMQKNSFIILAFYILLSGSVFIKYNLYNFEPQGRYFFHAISGIALFFTLGIYNLFTKKNENKFLWIYLASFMLIDIISIVRVLQFFY
ncbi:MAG: glycosyltransferase family 39 protein [Candidatus Woesearchaeota archaeon]|nr:glycosyltransferase family 39 protein [Candidatus Woesearchaeota archaeon]